MFSSLHKFSLAACALVLCMPMFAHAADWSLTSRGDAQTIRSVMMDGTNFISVGNKGSAFSSADNGKTWNPLVTNAQVWLYGVSALPDGNVFAVGENGTAITSSDHGKTWSQVNLDVAQNVYDVSSSKNTAYMVGASGRFFYYNASNRTWNLNSLGTSDDLYGVQDLGDGTGWVVGVNGGLFKVSQNGLSYAKITLVTHETLRSVHFMNSSNGWVVGTQGTVLHTTDGGLNWNSVTITGVTDQTLYSINGSGDHLVIAGDKMLITSDDNGQTWSTQPFAGTFYTFYDVAVASDGSAVAVGSDYDVSSLTYVRSATTPSVPVSPTPIVTPAPGANPPQGSLVKLPCTAAVGPNDPCKAVYFYATDGKRHAFPNDKVYFSWYTDFSTVQEVNADFLSSLPLGKNVTYRPGVKMVKFQTSPTVYVVARGGELRSVVSEAVAAALYGNDWNKKVDDISDAFYGNYHFGQPVMGIMDYDPVQARILVGSISENF